MIILFNSNLLNKFISIENNNHSQIHKLNLIHNRMDPGDLHHHIDPNVWHIEQ